MQRFQKYALSDAIRLLVELIMLRILLCKSITKPELCYFECFFFYRISAACRSVHDSHVYIQQKDDPTKNVSLSGWKSYTAININSTADINDAINNTTTLSVFYTVGLMRTTVPGQSSRAGQSRAKQNRTEKDRAELHTALVRVECPVVSTGIRYWTQELWYANFHEKSARSHSHPCYSSTGKVELQYYCSYSWHGAVSRVSYTSP